MKKRILIYIPVLVIVGVVAVLLGMIYHQKPDWQSALDQYLSFLRITGDPAYQVVTAVPAAQPANFTDDMSAGAYGDSVVFQTLQYRDAEFAAGLQPLPYPPDAVWCVLLKDGGQQELVYVALHNSLYNAEWVVHVSPDPWGSPATQATLRGLGCNFDL